MAVDAGRLPQLFPDGPGPARLHFVFAIKMPTPLDDSVALVSAEEHHLAAVNDCFIYFAALAETRHRSGVSGLFECLPPNLPKDCDEDTAQRLHKIITDFIERCPNHPNVGSAFRILFNLRVSDDLTTYLLGKLKFYYGQGDAHSVYQLCTVIEDLGLDVFRDETGGFIPSRSYNEAERNLGVARRFLQRQNGEPGSAANAPPPHC